MKKILVALLAVVLLLSVVGCNKTPPDVPDNTDKDKEIKSVEEQLLSYDSYDVFEDEIYLCDDVYRSDDTLTHGTGSISLPMGQDILKVEDYDILFCGDGCDPTAVVSRASQGYAPAYRVVADGEIDGNFKVLKFKMEIPEPMLEDIKKQGVYEQIVEEIESQYYYLLVLDEKHYAYIHLERIEGAEKIESEAELADAIVKNARISFEPDNKKFDLNIERVIRLAESKGEELTWDDFKMYNAIETGSGLYILVYEIDETFDLMIGGVPTSSPMYIRLVTKADRDNYIDIRTEDVEKFISENRKEAFETEYPVTIYSELVEVDSIPKGVESAVNTGNTADGLSHFYLFQYGLEYYRYDSETDTYYKGGLTLPNGYNDGKIHTFRQISSDRGIEIIIRAVDESGDIVYWGYKFAASIDPLNSQPSSRTVYDNEEDFIGVNAEFETEIVWENIDGEWYYSFRDNQGYKFYRLAFNSKTATMNFDYGFYESEYVNRYTGSYTVDATSQEITAVLHDSSIVHTDPDITLKFRLDSENSKGGVLVWKVVSCDVDKYCHLIGTNVEFTKNMQSILELSAAIDWKNVDGEWYYSFRDDEGYQFYGLAFNSNTGTMKFDYGFYESEYVNCYTGTYTVDSDSQEITAVLHDSSVMHTDPDITMKFHLASSENSGGAVLVWKVLSCDVEKYLHLVGTSVEFSKNMPTILELSGNQNQNDVSPVFDDALILVQSAGTIVKPYENFVWAQSYSENGWLSADGMRVSYKFSDVDNELPVITYSDDFAIHYGDGVELVSLMVYDSAFERVLNTDNIDALNDMAEGTYYLVITVKKQGDYIESDDKYEYTGYECVYKITITDGNYTSKEQRAFKDLTGLNSGDIQIL